MFVSQHGWTWWWALSHPHLAFTLGLAGAVDPSRLSLQTPSSTGSGLLTLQTWQKCDFCVLSCLLLSPREGREEGYLTETQFISTVLWLLFLLRSFAKYHGTGSSDRFALEFPNSIRESIQPFSPFLGLGPSRIPGRRSACIQPPGSHLSFPHPLLSFSRLVEIFSFQCWETILHLSCSVVYNKSLSSPDSNLDI